jgi:DNA-binding FadR family transcriptional regulator
LAVRFGVSRPTVREALKRLAARHLLRSRRGSSGGTFVNSPSIQEMSDSLGTAATLLVAVGSVSLEEVADARAEVGGISARLAAEHHTDEHLAGLRREMDIQKDPSISDQDFCASEVRFHRIIVDAVGNRLLSFMMNAVIEALLPVSNMIIFRVRDRRTIVGYHERITRALEQRDMDSAVAAMSDLMAYTRDRYAAAERTRQQRTTLRQGALISEGPNS